MSDQYKLRVGIIVPKKLAIRLFHPCDIEFLKSFADFEAIENLPETIGVGEVKCLIKNSHACIVGWGEPVFDENILNCAPDLKLLVHIGAVHHMLTDAVWERNIKVSSAVAAIAISVAETTIALMITALKRIIQFNERTHKGFWRGDENDQESSKAKELYNLNIGIIGAGYVGRNVIRLLKNFEVSILLYDPYVSDEEAQKLGVKKVSLEELMSCSDVVSLHAPETHETYHMINKDNLKLLKDGTIFINTARGAIVDEKALIEELKTGRITACIDVTDPEPPSEDNPLRKLPNVILTPHLAGVISNGLYRVGKYAINEVYNLFMNKPLEYEITKDMLERIQHD